MPYLGNEPNAASFISDTFSGDASTVNFTLSYAPGSPSALIVTIDGVKQHVAAYSVSGVTLTFTAAPPTGTNNIEVIHLGVRTEIGQPAANTVSPNETTGMQNVIQMVNITDGEVATGTTTLPADDTIPQITEGDEYMTLAITPTSATNILKIEVVANHSSSAGNNNTTVALFQDSTTNALGCVWNQAGGATEPMHTSFQHFMVAGTTSATTFRVRIGGNAAGTTTFNGSGGARARGGVMSSSITITEYKA